MNLQNQQVLGLTQIVKVTLIKIKSPAAIQTIDNCEYHHKLGLVMQNITLR